MVEPTQWPWKKLKMKKKTIRKIQSGVSLVVHSNAAMKTYPMLEALLTVDLTAWAIIDVVKKGKMNSKNFLTMSFSISRPLRTPQRSSSPAAQLRLGLRGIFLSHSPGINLSHHRHCTGKHRLMGRSKYLSVRVLRQNYLLISIYLPSKNHFGVLL